MAFGEPTDGKRVILQSAPGRGVQVALIGTVQPGDPLFGDSTGWQRANATSDNKPAMLIAGQPGVSGDKIIAYPDAIVDFGSLCDAVIGAHLYLSNTAGDYGASAGTVTKVCGRMMTARVAHVWGMHS